MKKVFLSKISAQIVFTPPVFLFTFLFVGSIKMNGLFSESTIIMGVFTLCYLVFGVTELFSGIFIGQKNTILLFLVVIIASLIPALIFGKWIEAIIFILCHTLIRPQFLKQYHHIIPAMCRTISAVVVFFGISFILPLEWSLFSAIPINYFISWVGCVKRERDDLEVLIVL